MNQTALVLSLEMIEALIITSINNVNPELNLQMNKDYDFDKLAIDSMQWMLIVSAIEKDISSYFSLNLDPLTLSSHSSIKKLAHFINDKYKQSQK